MGLVVSLTPTMAVISDDGLYRYWLRRKINSPLRWVKPCVFIMLNPSTADADLDDPTIRRCKGFAESFGCTDLFVVNLFGLRATDPKELYKARDPVGPKNDDYIRVAATMAIATSGPLICAWGTHGSYLNRDREVLKMLEAMGALPMALKVTNGGMPSHPLYLKSDLKPQELRTIVSHN
jgi:hypothetical protein